MKNETSITNIFRPYRAGRRVNVFPGLKPQAESFCPSGAIATAPYVDGRAAYGVRLTAVV